MKHKLATVLGAFALVGSAAGLASAAGGAEHAFLIEDYNAYEHFAPGDGPCVSWAGTFHEVRSAGTDLLRRGAARSRESSTSMASSTGWSN